MEQRQKLYTGLATCRLVAVNPDDDWLMANAPWAAPHGPYSGMAGDLEDSPRYCVVSLWLETDPQWHLDEGGRPLGVLLNTNITLVNQVSVNRRDGRKRIIDSYGRAAWADEATCENHCIPMRKNGEVVRISEDWHPCLVGEENLVKFTRVLLGIPNPLRHTRDGFKPIGNPDDALCDLSDVIDRMFRNNWNDLYALFNSRGHQRVRLLAGVIPDGKGRQTVYNNYFAPAWMDKDKRFRHQVLNDSTLDKSIVWSFDSLKEYTD